MLGSSPLTLAQEIAGVGLAFKKWEKKTHCFELLVWKKLSYRGLRDSNLSVFCLFVFFNVNYFLGVVWFCDEMTSKTFSVSEHFFSFQISLLIA